MPRNYNCILEKRFGGEEKTKSEAYDADIGLMS